MESSKRIIVLIWIVLCTLTLSVKSQVLTDTELETVSESIVKVYARHNEDKAASGFFYRSGRHVVTALHVVSGASRIQVKLSDNGALTNATIEKVLKDQDLALLRLSSSSGRAPLSSANANLNRGDEVLCVGYPFNIPTSDETLLKVKSGSRQLKDIVPPRVKRELDNLGFPSTNGVILSLDGHLLPGHSGAPIFNEEGDIVAISNGGLAVGSASRSWAIPARHLNRLVNSNESIPSQSVVTQTLFAEELSPDFNRRLIRSANTNDELIFIRRASYYELLNTTDDPLGLRQITQTFGPINLNLVAYDIYRETKSGATLVVPSNMGSPRRSGNFWRASVPNGLAELFFRINAVSSPGLLDSYVQNFETDLVMNDHQNNWSYNQLWSYPFPRPTLTGMTVRRKSFQKWYNGYPIKQLIVTYSYKDDLLFSSAAKLNNQGALVNAQANYIWFLFCTSTFLTTLAN